MTTIWNDSDIVGGSLSNGDSQFNKTSDADGGARAVASISGARYFEIRVGNLAASDIIGVGVAVLTHDLSTAPATGNNFWAWFSDGSLLGPTENSTDGSFGAGSRIRIAINGSSIWFGDESGWLASGDPGAGTGEQMSDVSGTVYPVIFSKKNGTIIHGVFDAFYYTPPSGFTEVGDSVSNPSDDDPTTPNPTISYANPNVNPTAISSPAQESWSHGDSATLVVTLDSIDVSARVVGQVSIKARRNEAKTARFTMIPDTGTLDANDLIGKSVTIDVNHVSQKRLFTGRVETPTVSPNNKEISFLCSDGIKDQVDAMARSAIDAEVGGWWSEYTDNKEADGYEYLKARVNTRNMAYDLDVNNSGVLASLDAESTPHFTFDNSTIDAGSFSYKLSERSSIFNKSQVSFDFRYTRLRHRERRFSWSHDLNLEFYFTTESYDHPTKYMIETAVQGLPGIQMNVEHYETLPLSGVYFGVIFINLNPNFVRSARWTQAQRFAQDITENYVVNINAPQSQGAVGTVQRSVQYGLTAEYDTVGWERFEQYEGAPGSFTLSPNGDYVEDQTAREIDGRNAFDNAVKTVIAREQTRIRLSHRDNWFEFKTELQPELQRFHTIQGNYNDGNFDVIAKGRVLEYEHIIDAANPSGPVFDTRVRCDLSKTDPGSPPADPGIAVPAAPDVSDTGPAPSTYQLDTHLYDSAADPTYDEAWEGFTGNFAFTTGGGDYPYAFNPITQPVGAGDRAHRAVAAVSSMDIPITDDLLTVTVA